MVYTSKEVIKRYVISKNIEMLLLPRECKKKNLSQYKDFFVYLDGYQKFWLYEFVWTDALKINFKK